MNSLSSSNSPSTTMNNSTPNSGSKPLDEVRKGFEREVKYYLSSKADTEDSLLFHEEYSNFIDALLFVVKPYLSEGGHNE